MKNKEVIMLIEELKQQVEECRDRDSSPYIDGLLRRTDFIINSLNVNNGVLDDVSQQRELLKKWWKYFDEESVAVNCNEEEREEVINDFFNCG